MSSWDEYFIRMAELVASRSKDPSTKVGCVVVSYDNTVLSTGYNGLPRGVLDLPERMERPVKYLWTAHAEENAVAQAARNGISLNGATAYVTHSTCCRCARALIQAGILHIVVAPGQTSMPQEEFDVAAQMFAEVDIEVVQWK